MKALWERVSISGTIHVLSYRGIEWSQLWDFEPFNAEVGKGYLECKWIQFMIWKMRVGQKKHSWVVTEGDETMDPWINGNGNMFPYRPSVHVMTCWPYSNDFFLKDSPLIVSRARVLAEPSTSISWRHTSTLHVFACETERSQRL